MGRHKFEEQWRDAFKDAESDVSDSTWARIELDLARVESSNNKTRVIYYRRLAASVAFLATLLASYIIYDQVRVEQNGKINNVSDSNTPSRLDNTSANESGKDVNRVDGIKGQPIASENPADALRETTETQTSILLSTASNSDEIGNSHPVIIATHDSQYQKQVFSAKRNRDFSPLSIPEVEVKLHRTEFHKTNFPRKLPAMPSFFMASSDKKANANNNLWASIGFAGGSYDPGTVSASGTSSFSASKEIADFSQALPQSVQASAGVAYSIGANVGKMISKRFYVQAGLVYLNQNIDYTSNYTALTPGNLIRAGVAEYSIAGDFVSFVQPYTTRSINEYLSIPLQMGYFIVDRKFGLQLNAGVATDFFIKNTLKDERGLIENYESGPSDGSPYRNVNWSGLMSTELSYKVTDKYHLSLVPGLRYNFNSVLKDETDLAYNPLVIDIGMRFKYIF